MGPSKRLILWQMSYNNMIEEKKSSPKHVLKFPYTCFLNSVPWDFPSASIFLYLAPSGSHISVTRAILLVTEVNEGIVRGFCVSNKSGGDGWQQLVQKSQL
jgi:hypothetical protein